MPALTDVVTGFLDGKGWVHVALDDGSIILTVDGQHARLRLRIFVDEQREQVTCYVMFPAVVPAASHPAVLDLGNRANQQLVLGNFELDTGRGELRFRTGIDVRGDRLTDALLTHVVHAGILTMDRYLPELVRVIRDADPAARPE
jgi:hypothetical protein